MSSDGPKHKCSIRKINFPKDGLCHFLSLYMWEVNTVAPLLHRVWLQMTSPTQENLTFILDVLASFLYMDGNEDTSTKFLMSVFGANFDIWPTSTSCQERFDLFFPFNPDVSNP